MRIIRHYQSEGIELKGNIKIEVYEGEKLKSVKYLKNLITSASLIDLIEYRLGNEGIGPINYMSWGDDDTAPTVNDTKLGNEKFRKHVTDLDRDNLQLVATTYLGAQEMVGQIEEIGWWAGGTSAKDSGTLVARALYKHSKTDTESINFVRTETYGGS